MQMTGAATSQLVASSFEGVASKGRIRKIFNVDAFHKSFSLGEMVDRQILSRLAPFATRRTWDRYLWPLATGA
jgi:hypothetical protein